MSSTETVAGLNIGWDVRECRYYTNNTQQISEKEVRFGQCTCGKEEEANRLEPPAAALVAFI